MSKRNKPVDPESLPYRRCVGAMVLNTGGLAWVGRRIVEPDSEFAGATQLWQMPQGGIDKGEEPLAADDIDGHVRLNRSTATPVAVGESLYSIRHFREYMQRGACSVVQVDVGRIGGITPWLKVAHMAEAFDMPVCPHFLMELHVSLVCAVPNGKYVEYIPQLDELTGRKMRIKDGHALAPEEPGLGIDWDFDALKARRIAEFDVAVTERSA